MEKRPEVSYCEASMSRAIAVLSDTPTQGLHLITQGFDLGLDISVSRPSRDALTSRLGLWLFRLVGPDVSCGRCYSLKIKICLATVSLTRASIRPLIDTVIKQQDRLSRQNLMPLWICAFYYLISDLITGFSAHVCSTVHNIRPINIE